MNKTKYLQKKQLLKLIDRLPGMVYQYREWPDGRCCFPYSTLAVEEIFFASPKELAKDASVAWEKITPDTRETLRTELNQSAGNLTEFESVFQTRSPQNRLHWIHNHAIPERLSDGSTLWYGHMENITAKYESEKIAKQNAALLKVIFENLPDHIYYKDREARMIGLNPACSRYHGKSPEEMIGKCDLDFYPSKLGQKIYQKEKELMEKGETFREREKHVRDDGTIVYLESVKCPLRTESGEIIGLAGISRDVTSQVKNEEAILASKNEAEQNASLIHAIFESLSDQVYYKDIEARVLGGNAAWLKVRNVERIEELIGKTDLEIHPAPLGKQLYDNEIKLLKTGKTMRVRERHEDEPGKITYVESIKSPFKNQAGKVIGLVGISRDITKQVNNERELIVAQQEAEAANKAKSAFLAMMSHEIRTPMNGVIGAASLLLGTELSESQEEFVHTIQISGENLLSIINDILDYSKIEAGKIELESIPFNLRECVEDAFDLFVQAAAKKNLELLCNVEPDVPEALQGDPTHLRQIIVNLLGNAIKFTEEGEVGIHVRTLTLNESTHRCQLQFSIHDTGIGISSEAQKTLFNSFTQADTSSTRKYGGTGLGLTISKRLTELMDGTIWIDSIEGEGSTFHFTIDLLVANAQKKQTDRYPSAQMLVDKRILIVDDNKTNRNILCAQMKQWGATPTVFAHPEQVTQHLQQVSPYDIILLDYQMPIMDGATLAKAIYKLPDYPPVPIIILSSSFETVPAHPAISLRLAKPVKMNKLKQKMLCLLEPGHDPRKNSVHSDSVVRPKKTRTLRILVAEDNPINQRVVQMMLQRLGYENSVFVEDGLEAIAAVIDGEYDVVLMDVQMPHMNGLDATIEIRKYTDNKSKPWIIALTAGVMEDEREKIAQSGMNEFLAKPLRVDQLEKKLDAACETLSHL